MILYYLYVGLLYLFFPIFMIRMYCRQRAFQSVGKGRLKERLGLFETLHFDQPLWIKAVEIVEAEQMKYIVPIADLMDFTLIMSFPCTVGSTPESSHLEVLQCCYSFTIIIHIILRC